MNPENSSTNALPYRPDIDGLRAIAVLGVIFFHAGWSWISGGYVGVDVFFVISGYLITRNILARKQAGKFSIFDFFKRRFLRLFPALFVTVALTLLVAMFVMPPQQLQETAYSASAAVMAFANVFFWTQTGYWDSEILSKPLVHTWTLSVEEQFYFIWPFLLAFLYKFRSVSLFLLLGFLGFVSLAASIWLTPKFPEAAFYLMPFRVFEFVIGALCVGIERKYAGSGFDLGRTGLFFVGLGLIAYAYLSFDETTAIPGWAVLIPTLGAAAIILAGAPKIFGTLLTNKVLVYMGLLSYSLYLVHWPVLSFIDQIWGDITFIQSLGILAGIFALSALLYHGIERPIRYAKIFKTGHGNRVFLGAVTGILGISLATQLIGFNKGFPERYQSDFEAIAAMNIDDVNAARHANLKALCVDQSEVFCGQIDPEKTNILIIGDSHGPDGFNIMNAAAPQYNYLVYATPACPPLRNLDNVFFLSNRDVCKERNQKFFSEVKQHLAEIEMVVLSVRHERSRIPSITETIGWFERNDTEVVVIGPGPTYTKKLQNVILQYSDVRSMTIAAHAATDIRVVGLESLIKRAVSEASGDYISRVEYFCPNGHCDPFIKNTQSPVTIDVHHLTNEAAIVFGETHSQDIHAVIAKVLFEKKGGQE